SRAQVVDRRDRPIVQHRGPHPLNVGGGWYVVKAMHVLVIAAALQATFAIQLDPDGVPGWHVEAVERTLPADVEDDQLTAVPEDKAEFVVRGTLTTTHLDYEVVGHPFAGTIDLIGRD